MAQNVARSVSIYMKDVPPKDSATILREFVAADEDWIHNILKMSLTDEGLAQARELIKASKAQEEFYGKMKAIMEKDKLTVSARNIRAVWEFVYIAQIMNAIDLYYFQQKDIDSVDVVPTFFRNHEDFTEQRYLELCGGGSADRLTLELHGISNVPHTIDTIVQHLRTALQSAPAWTKDPTIRKTVFVNEFSLLYPPKRHDGVAEVKHDAPIQQQIETPAQDPNIVYEAPVAEGVHKLPHVRSLVDFVRDKQQRTGDWIVAFCKLFFQDSTVDKAHEFFHDVKEWEVYYSRLIGSINEDFSVSVVNIVSVWEFIYITEVLHAIKLRFVDEISRREDTSITPAPPGHALTVNTDESVSLVTIQQYFRTHDKFSEEEYQRRTGQPLTLFGAFQHIGVLVDETKDILYYSLLQRAKKPYTRKPRDRYQQFIDEYERISKDDSRKILNDLRQAGRPVDPRVLAEQRAKADEEARQKQQQRDFEKRQKEAAKQRQKEEKNKAKEAGRTSPAKGSTNVEMHQRKAPDSPSKGPAEWQPDDACDDCNVCKKPFDEEVHLRRHCRKCGLLACDPCVTNTLVLAKPAVAPGTPAPTGSNKYRVCTNCYNKYKPRDD